MSPQQVVGIAEARAKLPTLIKAMAANPMCEPVLIGSHKNPAAVLMPLGQSLAPRPTVELLRAKASLIKTLATAHKLSTVSVIGSVARGDASDTSDVDLLCDAESGATLYDIASCETDLEQALGFPVTIITRASLTAADTSLLENLVPVC